METSWWNVDGAPTPDEWSALFAGLTLVAAVIAAAIALGQLQAHFATEGARNRPYVIVDYAFKSILMQIEIKNIGTTAARNVVLRVDPPFESGLRDQAATLNAVFAEPEQISMLAPGRRILYTFDRAPDYHSEKRPEKYDITATYTDLPQQNLRPWRRWWRKEVLQYTETFVLDFRQWSQTSTESDYDNKNWNIASRQERKTERIAKSLEWIVNTAKAHNADILDDLIARDVVQQDELTNDSSIEHPVDVPQRKQEPAEFQSVEAMNLSPTTLTNLPVHNKRITKRLRLKRQKPRNPHNLRSSEASNVGLRPTGTTGTSQ